MADALADLEVDPENVAAWRLFRRVVSRFTVDTASAAVVLERVTAELDPEAFDDLIQRFSILYDTLHPPPAPSGE